MENASTRRRNVDATPLWQARPFWGGLIVVAVAAGIAVALVVRSSRPPVFARGIVSLSSAADVANTHVYLFRGAVFREYPLYTTVDEWKAPLAKSDVGKDATFTLRLSPKSFRRRVVVTVVAERVNPGGLFTTASCSRRLVEARVLNDGMWVGEDRREIRLRLPEPADLCFEPTLP